MSCKFIYYLDIRVSRNLRCTQGIWRLWNAGVKGIVQCLSNFPKFSVLFGSRISQNSAHFCCLLLAIASSTFFDVSDRRFLSSAVLFLLSWSFKRSLSLIRESMSWSFQYGTQFCVLLPLWMKSLAEALTWWVKLFNWFSREFENSSFSQSFSSVQMKPGQFAFLKFHDLFNCIGFSTWKLHVVIIGLWSLSALLIILQVQSLYM